MGPELYEFECPHCHERTVVDSQVLTELVSTGCVFCGATVSESDFEPANPTP
ncbi:DUF7560 family zinc ribbon protein [Natronorubrum halalkaliphilum]|uniref:DUF7560 family zinc ribbon protein n=1 Tax=Natronorubrum halalkaliphilum TaxID=2691917 RepID=UPI003CCB88EC